ncbi:MAG: CDP-glycerol:glycerophosphate glycerophosphotransferase [Eubacterium sp.]|nr:CDP-glycerol:glycerophosphate glycerophosphotransferase [Eubacterium sp.]
MKVSVIIPYHGEQALFQEAMECLAKQSMKDFEVIVIGEEIPDFSQAFSAFITVKPTGDGVAAARNLGLAKASGDYVLFHDADDYLEGTAIETAVSQIGDADVLISQVKYTWYGCKVDFMNDAKLRRNNKQLAAEKNAYDRTSCLGILFRSEFLKNKKLLFDEELYYYPDVDFMAKVHNLRPMKKRCSKAFYYKREHNDPIQTPSLHQRGLYDEQAKRAQVEEQQKVGHLLPENEVCADKKKMMKQRLLKIKKALFSCTEWKFFLYHHVFLKMKVKKNLVVFESFLGRNYSDSPKYIYEYLVKHAPGKYKFVWLFNRPEPIPYEGKTVQRYSFAYFYYMARAGYMVFNGRQPVFIRKRRETTFLQTWHGTPLKKLVFDMDEVTSASPRYKEEVYHQAGDWDYLVAPNEFSAKIFEHCFLYHNTMLKTGYPRNDLLYLPETEKKTMTDAIKGELGIPLDKKVILYAPTWRDDQYYDHGKYSFRLEFDLEQMKERLGDEYVLLVRTHYFVVDCLDVEKYGAFAYNVSQYDDIARLYLISDVLITDYSSVFFDYANLRRPMIFFMYDLDKYRDVLRGFYIDVEEELPGPMVFDTEQLIETMEHLHDVMLTYQDKEEKFYEKYCGLEKGDSTRKVVEAVFGK